MFRLRAPLAPVFLATLLGGCGPAVGIFNDPHDLPALAQDPRVHYGAHAEGYAARIAELLPQAISKIEAAHGHAFCSSFVVAAYLDEEAYAAANMTGSTLPRGVTFRDRVAMSPALWRELPDALQADLTHELSHEHLNGCLSPLGYFRLPIWFVEGLAVDASDGGGAQLVSAREAKAEIAAGRFIETPDVAPLFGNFSLKPPPSRVDGEEARLRMHMAYRQAGLFVAYLREQNPASFKRFMRRLLDGESFKAAFDESYGESVADMRARFASGIGPKSAARL